MPFRMSTVEVNKIIECGLMSPRQLRTAAYCKLDDAMTNQP